ncbi:hypothetical protein [Burkholderia ubonensis]|uniref:hypothetical protein n=1 Tax=Burkholderia ubonensis TaxID=101571 RepID=UPI001E357B6C|nr:hypothetical protein [Burkholderia ubonensis]
MRDKTVKCKIIQVGKRRDGGHRYWCLAHHANATAKYGVPAPMCVAANDRPIPKSATLDLDLSHFSGGVALWGSVPAVYDTTRCPTDRGIHVHARRAQGDMKEIDRTYRKLRLRFATDLISDEWTEVDEVDAINYMVSGVFGFATRPVFCAHCGFAHLDRDWFAVHPHRRHQCHGCGFQFSDAVAGIGNPLSALHRAFESRKRRSMKAPRTISVRQHDYAGGIQIWGSNPAIVWTSPDPEETGIHLHCFAKSSDELPAVDDTYAKVVIDGISVDAEHVRHFMAQKAMPHLEGRVVALDCPHCQTPHFDTAELAYTPHLDHKCVSCGKWFQAATRTRKTIGNPFAAVRLSLAETSPNPLRNDPLRLRPETI